MGEAYIVAAARTAGGTLICSIDTKTATCAQQIALIAIRITW